MSIAATHQQHINPYLW